jgi:hypothetical protein
MTSLLLPQKPSVAWFHSGDYGFEPTKKFAIADGGKNVLQLSDVPVFRSGAFRDSMGDLNTWESLHMQQMKSNFDYLVSNKTFSQVPVRRGHGSFFSDPMDSLIGWHTGIRSQEMQSPVDGLTYTYLLADYYVFDQAAAENIDAGNWPNRSSEVGTYVNNVATEYWPCYMGFAYVDIPAVEGLNFSKYKKDAGPKFSILIDNPKEFGVTQMTPPAAPPALPEPQLPVAPAGPTQPLSFSIGGKSSSDYAAVQAHIVHLEGRNATLEQFATESARTGRLNFVSALAADGKILQTQVGDQEVGKETGLTAHVVSLDDAQFSAFKAIYEAIPPNALLGKHGQANATGNPIVSGGQPKDERTERMSVLTEIIGRHRMSGKSDADIAKMPSYIELQQLTAAGS